SHWSTSKTPSYTKSVSWQHHRLSLAVKYFLFRGVNFANKENISPSARGKGSPPSPQAQYIARAVIVRR
ncbi:hypothetical protein, partial [Klebsiella pneumoniae]